MNKRIFTSTSILISGSHNLEKIQGFQSLGIRTPVTQIHKVAQYKEFCSSASEMFESQILVPEFF